MSADSPQTERQNAFAGYRRPDGRVGVRNQILVLPSVICSHVVAEEIADHTSRAVATPHDHGCGQLGADSDQTERTLVNLAANPNVAGTLVVGLGCEKVRSDAVAAAVAERGLPVEELTIQDVGGTEPCVERGVRVVERLTAQAVTTGSASLGDLTVGVVVDDLIESTVEHAYPLIKELIERVVLAGGQVVVAGNERFAAHPEKTRALIDADIDRLLDSCQPSRARRVGVRAVKRSFEAATGFIGDTPVEDVVAYGETARTDGAVTILDAPSRFEEATTGLAAAGAHVVVHVTGQGIPAGHPIVPVLKVSGDENTLAAVPDDIDVDARQTDPDALVDRLVAVADGDRVSAEKHGLTEFAITRVGPST